MFQQDKRWTPKSAALLVLLIILGFWGNFSTFSLLFGADFLFGSIAVLLVLYYYGLGWGMLAALLANGYTYFLWGHPYGFLNFTLEALFIGLLLRSGRRNLILLDGLFWLILGIPSIWFFYGFVMQMDAVAVSFVMLKQSTNGIFNALLASLAISYLPLHQLFGRPQDQTRRLQDTLFNLIVAMVLLPAMIAMALEIKRETEGMETRMVEEMEAVSAYTQMSLHSWYKRHLQALSELAALAANSSMTPSGQLQHETEILKKSFPGFRTLHVGNGQGKNITFSPEVDGRGELMAGPDFSQSPWFKEIRATHRPAVSEVSWCNRVHFSPIVSISVPVLKENNFLGAATGALDLSGIQELLPATLNKEINLILIDSQGRVIASSLPNLAPMSFWDRKKIGESQPLKASVYRWMPGDQSLPHMTRWKNSFYIQETSIDENLPWKLVLEAPVAPKQRLLHKVYVDDLSPILILAVMAMLLALSLSRWIAQPLEKLAKATTDLPRKLQGSSEIDWPESSAQEIHSLIGNFQLMAGILERNSLEIQDNSAQLAKANQELRKEIAERQRAEEALRESEQQLANIIDFLPDPTLVIDTKGKVIAWNKAMEEMTGIKAQDILGKGDYQYSLPFYGERRPILIDLVLKPQQDFELKYLAIERGDSTISGESPFISHLKGGEGAYLSGKASVLRDSNGNIVGAIQSIRDITERRKVEEALRQSEQRFRLLAETIQDVFWITTPALDKFLYASPAYESIWGRSREELYRDPKSFANAMPPEDRDELLRQILQFHAQKAPFNLEYRIIRPDGTVRWIHVRGFPAWDEQGNITMMAGVCTDVTERKLLESQLIQSQKMEAVGRLAGGVAHDFNNILTAIMGYTELMTMKLSQDDPMSHDVTEIQQSAERAATLTRQLLAFSRKQIFQPKVLNLNELVANLDKMLRRLLGEDIDLVTVQSPGLGQVLADPGQVEQVIINLAVNARDAMPRGGKLTIETANVDLDEAYARQRLEVQPGPYVMVAVSDTGEGIEPDTLSHIFEPFFTTKGAGKGSGLGLSMVHGIVKQSGGHIAVYSEPGDGTTFKVYLPRLAQSAKAGKEVEIGRIPDGGSETILLVEDEEAVRKVIRRVLEMNGYKILEANSGREAQLLGQQHAGPIHLMLTDVVMPEMSGREVADLLLTKRPELKVLYMSGHTENAIVHHGVLGKNVAFIQKPFRHSVLLDKIRQVLDSA